MRELGDAVLKQIALELTEKLRKSTSVDWQKRESVKAAIRNAARVVLRRLGYPASAREAVLEQVLSAIEPAAEGES